MQSGGDLSIESLQDTSKYKSKQQSASASVTVGVGFSGSVSVGQQKMNSDYASVTEQTGIRAGDGGFQLDVGGHTGLKGGIIASTGQAVQDGANRLTTGTLSYSDIRNHANYSASSVSLGGGYSSKDFSLKPMGGGGDSAAPSSGVGTCQDGTATTGGDKVPGSELPAYNGWSATPPIAMMAKGSGSSTTRSGISSGTLILTDGDPQSLAGLNRNVSTERDSSNTLKPIFDKDKIEAGFAIVEALQRETGTFLSNRAKETTQAKADLDKELAKPESERDSQKLAVLTQQIKDNTTWEMGGSGRQILTALMAGAGANVTGGAVDMLQGAAANYLQGLETQQVKEIADKLDSEVARAALQGLVACAGAAAQGGSCGAGASGAAASVVLNNLLDGLNGKAVGSLTAEEKEARSNLISSIVAGTTAATGGETTVAAIAAKLETENNALALPFLLPGLPGKPRATPLPGLPGYDKTERELGLEPRGGAEQLVELMGKGLEGIPHEYPPAMFKEGGKGSSVRHINPSDNRGAGACIGVQCRQFPNGAKVRIDVVD